jgi:hypothetical protein
MANAPNAEYATNLMRYAASVAYAQFGLSVAREMFGKSYFSLGAQEKTAVDNASFGMVAANFQFLTAQNLTTPAVQSPVGFQSPPPTPPTPQNSKG